VFLEGGYRRERVRNGQAGRRGGKRRGLGDSDVNGHGFGPEGGEAGRSIGAEINSDVGRAAKRKGGKEARAFSGYASFGGGDMGERANSLEDSMEAVAEVGMESGLGIAAGEEEVAKGVGRCAAAGAGGRQNAWEEWEAELASKAGDEGEVGHAVGGNGAR
jgi:hypothetical protein